MLESEPSIFKRFKYFTNFTNTIKLNFKGTGQYVDLPQKPKINLDNHEQGTAIILSQLLK